VFYVTDDDTDQVDRREDGENHIENEQGRPLVDSILPLFMTSHEDRKRKPSATTTGPTLETCDPHDGAHTIYAVSRAGY
jgi:hypothetical protein